MRVAIVNLTAGTLSGGYRKYLDNIIPRMAEHRDVDALLCAAPRSYDVAGRFGKIPNIQPAICLPHILGRMDFDRHLDRSVHDFRPDVIFVPAERFYHFDDVPIVNMVRNMEPMVCPFGDNPLSEKLKNFLKAVYARRAVRRARRVIAVSEFVRSFLTKRWGLSGEKVGQVYHGCDPTAPGDVCEVPSLPAEVRDDFVFTAGSVRPARGLEDLFRAMRHMASIGRRVPPVVVAGSAERVMTRYLGRLKRWIEREGLSQKVYWVGELNEKEMAWCFRACKALVMTSRVESFGQIAVEAMSHGACCISARNPCLPEVFGEAAVFYSARNFVELADRLEEVLGWDEMRVETRRDVAKRRAGAFSWRNCVNGTVEQLKQAVT